MSRWAAWGLWGATVALVPAAVVFGVLALPVTLPEGREEFLPLVLALCVEGLVYATTGAAVASRRPRNPIGWIFCTMGLCLALVAAAYGYADYGLYGGADVPYALYAGWLTSWLFILPVFIAPCFALFLFPDGRSPSPRWGPVVGFFALAGAAAVVWSALEPGELVSYPGRENPLAVEGIAGDIVEGLNAAGEAFLAPLLFLVALASVVIRFRRASGLERLQIKWVAYAAAVMAVCFAGSFVAGTALPQWTSDALFGLGFAAFGGIGVAAGLAILRYRLYDIGVVIRRTLVYGVLSVGLAGLYVGVVLALQQVFSPLTGGNELAIAGSTLAVAALFRPARRRIQELVDRRFYRSKVHAQRTLEVFGARLREEIDLEALSAELRAVVQETMQPNHVSLWLRDERELVSLRSP